MIQNKLIASLMLSGTVLMLAAPVANAAESSSSTSSKTSSSVTNTSKVSSSLASDKTKAESTSSESKNDSVQTLKEQKMIIKKIIAKEGSKMATVSEAKTSESKNDTNSNSSSTTSTSSSSSNSSSSSLESKTDTPAGGTSNSSVNDEANKSNTSSSSSQAPGLSQSDFKGVPNSKFVVYDVTDTMNSVIKDKLGVDEAKANAALQVAAAKETSEDKEKTEVSDSASSANSTESKSNSSSSSVSKATSNTSTSSLKETTSDSSSKTESSNSYSETKDDKDLVSKVEELRKGDTIRKEVSERAAKLNKDQLKKIAEVTTDQNGAAETKLPIDGKYHAYYVVNTETAKDSYATNSAPIVVITPVTDSQGVYAPEFTIYPKSNSVPKPNTPQETQAKMFQTGHNNQSFFSKVVNWLKAMFN